MSGVFDAANDWVGRELSAHAGAGSFVYLFVGGALASLLPCVYPLYPITAALLGQRKSRLGGLAHPLAYYAGLCTVYFLFGLIASLAGGAFNGVLRLPLANLAIGVTLFVLALSTVGLLHFPMLSIEEGSGAGLATTFVMGAGAGLLSSACVGPVVVSILVQLAAHAGALEPAAVVLAALKMFVFGMGVGSPLLLIGIFGLSLPKGRRWMLYPQWGFGVLIAYFAIGYVGKGLSGLGLSPSAERATLLGAAMVGLAAYARQSAELPVDQRTRSALLTLLGVVGFFVLGRSILGSPSADDTRPSNSDTGPVASAVEEVGPLRWHLDKAAAYKEAALSGRPVFLDFHGDWCTNCKAFQEQTQRDEQLRSALSRAVLLKVYDSSPLFVSYSADPRFAELRVGLPFFVITDAKGELLYKTSDYTNTDEIALFLSDS